MGEGLIGAHGRLCPILQGQFQLTILYALLQITTLLKCPTRILLTTCHVMHRNCSDDDFNLGDLIMHANDNVMYDLHPLAYCRNGCRHDDGRTVHDHLLQRNHGVDHLLPVRIVHYKATVDDM